MKICRFDFDRLGVVDGDVVIDVTAALDAMPALLAGPPMACSFA